MSIARQVIRGKASLDALIDLFDIDGSCRNEYHGALVDAELLLKVFLCLKGKKKTAQLVNFDTLNHEDDQYQNSYMVDTK